LILCGAACWSPWVPGSHPPPSTPGFVLAASRPSKVITSRSPRRIRTRGIGSINTTRSLFKRRRATCSAESSHFPRCRPRSGHAHPHHSRGGAACHRLRSLCPLHVRLLRRRQLESVRSGRLPGGGRVAVARLQSTLHLRWSRPGEDAPPPRGGTSDRPPLSTASPALSVVGALHQRLDQRHPLRSHRGVSREVSDDRSPPHRRHPVHLGQGADP